MINLLKSTTSVLSSSSIYSHSFIGSLKEYTEVRNESRYSLLEDMDIQLYVMILHLPLLLIIMINHSFNTFLWYFDLMMSVVTGPINAYGNYNFFHPFSYLHLIMILIIIYLFNSSESLIVKYAIEICQ
jgi:hypothetical protein